MKIPCLWRDPRRDYFLILGGRILPFLPRIPSGIGGIPPGSHLGIYVNLQEGPGDTDKHQGLLPG